MPEPMKAYQITYTITVAMEALAYGHSANDALERFREAGQPGEATGNTGRAKGLRAVRWPDDDLDSLGDQDAAP